MTAVQEQDTVLEDMPEEIRNDVERWITLDAQRKEITKELDDITAWIASRIQRKAGWSRGTDYVSVTVVRPETPVVDIELLAELAPGLAELVTTTKTVIDRDALKQMIELGLFDDTMSAHKALTYKPSAPSLRFAVRSTADAVDG